MKKTASNWPIVALLLAGLSGAAGVAHQLLWVRRLVDVLGADPGTFSRVIGAFFLGLAGGAWFAARRATPRPWLSVARAELTVAVLAALLACSTPLLHFGQGNPVTAALASWLLPLFLIAPPAMAMGAVIPWMIRAIGSRHSVGLYAVNTFGGIAGVVLVLVWALPTLGLTAASFAVLAMNLVIAIIASTQSSTGTVEEPLEQEDKAASSVVNITAFASGFLVLGTEVIFHHQLAQYLISSHYADAAVLLLVLTALGLGAVFITLGRRLGPAGLSWALGLAALACAAQPILLIVQRGGLNYLPFDRSFAAYAFDALKLIVPGCVLPLLPAALVFPLLLRRASALGIDAGRLFAINGLGGWCGAEITAWLIAPLFGLWWSMALLAAGYLLCLLLQVGTLRWFIVPGLAAVIAWSCVLDTRLPYVGLAKDDSVVKVSVGREGVVSILKNGAHDESLLINNTYTLGGSRAQTNQERQGLLPVLLHGQARRVATIGVATGSTVAGTALDPTVESIEGIELSRLVLRFARDDFSPINRWMADDPRVRLTLGDARQVLRQRQGEFDVVVGDLFLPWNTGEGRLFTREHFDGVRAALRPGGLYCQWLPLYQLTKPQFEAIVRTFRQVFPEAWIVRGDFYAEMPIVGLIGGRALSSIDWTNVTSACDRVRDQGVCRDPLMRKVDGVAMCVAGPASAPATGPVITLANCWIEWDAARNVIGRREPWFIGVPLAQYLRTAQQSGAALLPASLRRAHLGGDWCLAVEIARAARLPQGSGIEAALQNLLTESFGDDELAEWEDWPLRHATHD